MKFANSFIFRFFGTFFFLLTGRLLYAHVKWFSQFSFEDEPLQLADITTTTFWILAVASLVVVALVTQIDKRIEVAVWYKNTTVWLEQYKDKSLLIMRVAVAVVLLMAWQLGTLVMPELSIKSDYLLWFQFLLAFLLLFRKTVPLTGAGMVLLYFIAIYKFGVFHMLDYLLLVGVAYYFITCNSKQAKYRDTGLLLLYITIGFSLCWAGMEKLIYPEWGTYLLELYPRLALGLDVNLFVQGAAFIEISVGVMFIFCYFQRLLAVVVTLLFILTSLTFGSTEVTGHLVLHAAFIIFIIEGSGNIFNTLPSFYRKFGRNPVFAGLGFAILLFAFAYSYPYSANNKYNEVVQKQLVDHPHNVEISDAELAPQLEISISKDQHEGWNLELITEKFNFKTPNGKNEKFTNNGYAVLSINGELIARIYNKWYYMPPMEPGTYKVEVELVSLNNERLTHLGQPIKVKRMHVVE